MSLVYTMKQMSVWVAGDAVDDLDNLNAQEERNIKKSTNVCFLYGEFVCVDPHFFLLRRSAQYI
jgi:hypothetical protein